MNLKQLIAPQWVSSNRDVLVALSTLLIALVICALIFLIPPTVSIIGILYYFRVVIASLLIIFLGMVFSRKGIVWDALSLSLTLILFSLPLIYKWQTGMFYGSMFGGLLPWSDAQGYYAGAHNLMNAGYLTSWATRRPLFAGFLAVLFSITGNNLQISLGILAILNGLAVFLTAREIQKIYGSFTAATFAAICYWYYCSVAGATTTEQIGMCFGCLGMACLIRASRSVSLGRAAYGLFLLTIALNARAGAFFILPLIVLWLGIHYRRELGWRKPVMVGITVVAMGMLGNLVMVKAVGSPNAVPFSNYSYTLYGLASGNKGWMQVMVDYPGVKEDEVFELAIQKIKDDPSLFLLGILRSYQDYFTERRGAFSFLALVNDRRNMGSQLLWILTGVGLAWSLFKYKQGQYALILAAFLGILLSVSLVPPKDANSMRIYAATIPFTAYLASMGIAFLDQSLKKVSASTGITPDGRDTSSLLLPFSAVLLALCFSGPLLLKMSAAPQILKSSVSCQSGEKEIIFSMGSGSNFKVVDDQSIRESYLPNIRMTDFSNGTELESTFYPFLAEALLSLKPGSTVSIGTYQKDESSGPDLLQTGYLVTSGELLRPGLHQICATPAPDEQLRDFFFYYEPEGSEAAQQGPSIFYRSTVLVDRVRDVYGAGVLLMYGSVVLSYFGFWLVPLAKRLLLFLGTLLILGGILVYLHSNALFPLAWERKPLEMKDAIHMGGYSYRLPLGLQWMDRRAVGESPVIVYEDGKTLKRPNSTPFAIKNRGKGRFSVEGGDLFISSSDNSDPRNNGRKYEIYWPTPLSRSSQRTSYALAISSALLLLLHLRKITHATEASATG